jgi:hypothetical protein
MNDRRGVVSPEALPRPGEVALLTAINVVLDVPADELPGRVALVRRYVAAALDAVPGSRRTTFQVIAQMLALTRAGASRSTTVINSPIHRASDRGQCCPRRLRRRRRVRRPGVRRAAVWLLWSGAESAEALHMPVRDECLGCGEPEAPAVAGHQVGTCQPV